MIGQLTDVPCQDILLAIKKERENFVWRIFKENEYFNRYFDQDQLKKKVDSFIFHQYNKFL